MNAPGEIVKGVSRTDYEAVVKSLRPHVGDEELKLRSSLLLARDVAMATKAYACESAWKLLDVIERETSAVALDHHFKPDDLRKVHELVKHCAIAAQGFDKLYQPMFPGISDGEANAKRG